MEYCASCGMPLSSKEDIKADTDKGPLCEYCINENGSLKSCEEVFEGGVQFFMGAVPGTDRQLAERLTRKNMNNQPCWEDADNECLKGDEATDEEFQEALNKLHS